MENPKMVDLRALTGYEVKSERQMLETAEQFYQSIRRRRTVRNFSDKRVPCSVIDRCIQAAGTAPSGANLQPWHFAVVTDSEIKRKIRVEAENEEQAFYSGRAPNEWLKALEPFATDQHKPFLERASHLIVVFSQSYVVDEDGNVTKHYYPMESTGIAAGMLITALHQCGLATLTHTPSPMKFLNQILGRPAGERPFVLLVVGYPSEDAIVPDITKKDLHEVVSYH